MISVQHLCKICNGRTVLSDITLLIHPGERVCIVGPSGSGKTLILKILLGLVSPTKGSVEVDGVPLQNLPPRILQMYRQKIGTIFQEEDRCSLHETVFEHVSLPLILRNTPPTLTTQKILETLQALSLKSHTQFFLKDLSHGERKLTDIAHEVVTDPLLIFADEPLEGLDTAQATLVCNLFKRLNKEGATLIIATRDPLLADQLHCRTLILKDGYLHEDDSSFPNQEDSLRPKTIERSVKITAVK